MTSIRPEEEVAALLDRYLISLDDEKLDEEWAQRLFTDDVRIEFPISRHDGIVGLVEFHTQSLAAFERTQHLNSPAVVVADGDHASFRANLISTHVHRPVGDLADGQSPPLFATGTFLNGEARNTPDGWRLSLLTVRLVWSTGSPPRKA